MSVTETTNDRLTEADAEVDEATEASDVAVDEVLVEEISIDGMCGVY